MARKEGTTPRPRSSDTGPVAAAGRRRGRAAAADVPPAEGPVNPFRSALQRAFMRRADAEADTAAPPLLAAGGASDAVAAKAMVSPLAPAAFPMMPPIAGVSLATVAAGIRYRSRPDLVLASFAPGTTVAGVFTTSRMLAAPVEWCRARISAGQARALLVNAGNANAFTGRAGVEAVKASAAAAARLIGCRQSEVFLASTGVIGEPLPVERLTDALPDLRGRLAGENWPAAAEAIMTTDTFPKGASRRARIGEAEVTINGIAKGSGMIAPDMATMLAFVATDAAIPAEVLQTLLILEVRESFNCITVDGDTSTNDTVLLFATGRGPAHEPITRAADRRLRDFRLKLAEVMCDLAQQIVRDGEGATKFVTVRVTGAANARAARAIALAIANSPLVKTAIAGEDPNWGRVVAAVGKAGEAADRDALTIAFGSHVVASNGARAPDYEERRVAAYMRRREIEIAVDVGVGTGEARIWTCDLTRRYIEINADYRS